LVGEVSQLINELTGNERSAFCNTGSEAVLGAMRIARTVTGRDKIIVFTGSYHGINDEVILRAAKSGASYPAAPGINSNSVSNMIVLDYGTAESLEKIRALASDVAAVLVEPVQSRRCDFQPVEFLREVRRLTEAAGTCLIFDEVITGFRNHPGGAQAQFGIRADLCAYGKIVGGGMPIGVISGKSAFMDALDGGFWQFGDESTPTVGVTYFAGTFVRHPLALAAAKGALEIIKREGVAGLARVANRADTFARELNLFLNLSQVPLRMDNFGGLMKPKWTAEITGGELLFTHLRYFGVHAYDGFPWFINLAHTEDDLNFVLSAFKKAVTAMQLMGVFPMTIAYQDVTASAPVPGAVLGRDLEGNPGWYVETSTGSFSRLEAQ
jgi:glutamate-1-semialdehyde aminotransferase